MFVHRWTAFELHRLLTEQQRGGEITDAQRRAAEYWRRRITAWPLDHRAQSAAGYHLLQVSELSREIPPEGRHRAANRVRPRLRPFVLAGAGLAVSALLAVAANGVRGTSAGPESLSPAVGRAPTRNSGLAVMARDQAAAWIASQVGGDMIVACDPAMCSVLLAHGVLAGNQLVLRSATADPLGSAVVVATPAVRSQFGTRLASVDAPEVIASFGSGDTRIDVRAVAPDGAAAFGRGLAADLAARRAAGRQLLRNSRIRASPGARAALLSGQVDDRLVITLAALAAAGPVQIESFGAPGPGAGSGVPLRSAELAGPGLPAATTARLQSMLAFVRAQRPPYLAERAALVRGAHGFPVLSVLFAAPSPLGLLQTQATPLADSP